LSPSTSVSRARWSGGEKRVTTGIYKETVTGRVPLRRTNLDGDRQADLRVHGGPEKAVYAYPSEFYELWSRERPELVFGPGTFGENLTTEGLLDGDVSIGDRFRFGTAELVVTQPRLPCFKLGIKMGRRRRAAWRRRVLNVGPQVARTGTERRRAGCRGRTGVLDRAASIR
jgi:MOSC domain-containing protein YiiM